MGEKLSGDRAFTTNTTPAKILLAMDAVNGGRNSFDQEDGEHLNLQDEDAKPDDFTVRQGFRQA